MPDVPRRQPTDLRNGDGELLTLQYMRGLAAMMVLIFHLIDAYIRDFGRPPGPSVTVLASGVDIFFVISGAIIIVSTRRGKQGVVQFLSRRVIRILPAYWLATAGWMGATAIFPEAMRPTPTSPLTLFRSLVLAPPAHGDEFMTILPVGWSLCYEVYFYAVVAVVLGIRPFRTRVAAVVAAVSALALARATTLIPPVPYFAPISVEFVFGCLLALFATSARADARPWLTPVAWSAGVLWLATIGLKATDRLIGWGVPAAAIVFGAINLDRSARRKLCTVPEIFVLRRLGDASYSIYLWHLPAFVVTAGVVRMMTRSEGVLVLTRLVVSLALGLFMYAWFEEPTIRLLRRRSHLPPAVAT